VASSQDPARYYNEMWQKGKRMPLSGAQWASLVRQREEPVTLMGGERSANGPLGRPLSAKACLLNSRRNAV